MPVTDPPPCTWMGCLIEAVVGSGIGEPSITVGVFAMLTLLPGASPTVPVTEPVTGTGFAGVLTTLTCSPSGGPAATASCVAPSTPRTARPINPRRIAMISPRKVTFGPIGLAQSNRAPLHLAVIEKNSAEAGLV